MSGIGSHTLAVRGQTDSWITPREIIEALGVFDLDPCACIPQPWACAKRSYTTDDNGLHKPWGGRVWLNPPYGVQTGTWLARLADHGSGTALVFARTETAMFFRYVWPKCSALLFLEGRLHFCYPDGRRATGNAGGPSVLIAYGERDSQILANCGLSGKVLTNPLSRP